MVAGSRRLYDVSKGRGIGTGCRNHRAEDALQKTDGLSDLHVRPPTAFR